MFLLGLYTIPAILTFLQIIICLAFFNAKPKYFKVIIFSLLWPIKLATILYHFLRKKKSPRDTSNIADFLQSSKDRNKAANTAQEPNEEALHHHRIALEIYNDLPWWKKRRRNAPAPQEEKE